ncbi:MAG: hypothetical protein LBJ67_10480 [Planctomycetaceae bacterium]|nr:hypothetical protein [Planctomycetaceae bacterium]
MSTKSIASPWHASRRKNTAINTSTVGPALGGSDREARCRREHIPQWNMAFLIISFLGDNI